MEKIIIETLTNNFVNIKKVTINANNEQIGEPWLRSYKNSNYGRKLLAQDLPITYVNAILMIWGDIPTESDSIAE